MFTIFKKIAIIILVSPLLVHAGYNGYIANTCENFHRQGMTYDIFLSKKCSKIWFYLTEQSKKSFPKK